MAGGNIKMKIAQLGPVPPPHGGVSTNMMAIHEALLRQGHDSVVIDVINRRGTQNAANILKPHSAAGLFRLLLTLECDIVHYHAGGDFNAKLALLTFFCGLLPGRKSVLTFHSGGYARDSAASAQPFSLRGFALRSIDRLIGVNDQIIEMFLAFGVPGDRTRKILPFELKKPDRTVDIPEELDRFAKSVDPLLLSIGALEPEYLNCFLIESMPAVLERWPNAGLLIAGSGSLESELKQKIAANGLTSRVMLAGNIEHGILLHIIDRADAVLRITEYDGDAISVREAIFLGKPVVATDNGMRPAGVHLISTPAVPDEFVIVLCEALADKRGRPSEPNGDGSNAEKVIEVYRELISG